ncbi:MAG: prepilin-type N-terminal cleavage/methylation domain-containing protein [bacterium]
MKRVGFTLIELIVVVSIIAILAAIAIPNFIEAQTRAKVSRAKSDLRTIAIAVEAYCTDHGKYPDPLQPYKESLSTVNELSTPVAYLTTTQLPDAFPPTWVETTPPPPPGYSPTYWYNSFSGAMGKELSEASGFPAFSGYCLCSVGPDRVSNAATLLPFYIDRDPKRERNCLDLLYDPTNGTISSGDIARWAGKAQKYRAN